MKTNQSKLNFLPLINEKHKKTFKGIMLLEYYIEKGHLIKILGLYNGM